MRELSVGNLLRGAVLAALMLISACAWVRWGWTRYEVQGQTLQTSSGAGQERLAVEADYDYAIANWIKQNGRPDYIRVESRTRVVLFYIDEDRTVVFQRPRLNTLSQAQVAGRIIQSDADLFTQEDRQRLTRVREAILAVTPKPTPSPTPAKSRSGRRAKKAAQPTQAP